MPIYEYKCRKCGKDFELFQRMTDPAVKSCQFCKGPV
ncbi:MAG: zinc ribbon domain-containing protein, partial [Syntrophus sp. (in: bacteria)]